MGNLFCCVQVDQSTVAIKETFGKFEDVLEPGCHFLPWCLGQQVAGYLSLRLQQLDVRCETKTKVFFTFFFFNLLNVSLYVFSTDLDSLLCVACVVAGQCVC